MGKQTNIKLRGTVGNIIYYQWKGIDCIRTVPVTVRQTANTKRAASVFGLAAKAAARFREMIRPVLAEPGNRAMMHELDNAFRRWLHTEPLKKNEKEEQIPFFNLFSFNKKATVGPIFKSVQISRTENGELMMMIPALNPVKDITAPKNTTGIGVELIVSKLPFDKLDEVTAFQTGVRFPYSHDSTAEQVIHIEDAIQAGTLVIVTMALQFYTGGDESLPIQQIRWKPSSIINSFYN